MFFKTLMPPNRPNTVTKPTGGATGASTGGKRIMGKMVGRRRGRPCLSANHV